MFWKEAIRLDVIIRVSERAAEFKPIPPDGKNPFRDRYCTLSDECPALLHQCGLLQAWGFLKHKDESNQWTADFLAIAENSLRRNGVISTSTCWESVMEAIVETQASDENIKVSGNTLYMHVHRVAVVIAIHMKKEVATFMLESGKSSTNDQQAITQASSTDATS